jgi:hypothetical protein
MPIDTTISYSCMSEFVYMNQSRSAVNLFEVLYLYFHPAVYYYLIVTKQLTGKCGKKTKYLSSYTMAIPLVHKQPVM